jgi:4-hydroxy-3-methylbut-2-enyl diphosphate reductase
VATVFRNTSGLNGYHVGDWFNQTTTYKKEHEQLDSFFKDHDAEVWSVDVATHYMEFDTICDALQAINSNLSALFSVSIISGVSCLFRTESSGENVEKDLDFILVIGGFDSSNTAHLLEIPVHAGVRAFHIDRAECIGADNSITHRLVSGEMVTEPFLLEMDKEVVMGVTSGASTPDAAVQESLSQIFLLKSMYDAARK